MVLECTGKFLNHATLDGHLKRGAKRVIVAAPVKEPDVLNVVVGVNHHLYDPASHPIVTAASCTTNCLAPVVKVVHEAIGIRHGQITTIHDPTNTNVVTMPRTRTCAAPARPCSRCSRRRRAAPRRSR